MGPAYLLNSFAIFGLAEGCICAICWFGCCWGAAWFCAGGAAAACVACCGFWGPLDPDLPGGGVAKLLRSSFTSSSGCRVMAVRFLSEAIFVFGRGCCFCKSGGSSRNVISLAFERFFTATAVCHGRYFSNLSILTS